MNTTDSTSYAGGEGGGVEEIESINSIEEGQTLMELNVFLCLDFYHAVIYLQTFKVLGPLC